MEAPTPLELLMTESVRKSKNLRDGDEMITIGDDEDGNYFNSQVMQARERLQLYANNNNNNNYNIGGEDDEFNYSGKDSNEENRNNGNIEKKIKKLKKQVTIKEDNSCLILFEPDVALDISSVAIAFPSSNSNEREKEKEREKEREKKREKEREKEIQAWSQITALQEKIEENEMSAEIGVGGRKLINFNKSISYKEVEEYYREKRKIKYNTKNDTRPIEVVSRSKFIRIIFGPPILSRRLEDDRNFFFAMAQQRLTTRVGENNESIENDNEMAERVLLTIYKKLTGTDRDCPIVGPHWEDVGFQGSDPSTDLRGVGMLGLIQLLKFITFYPLISQRIYLLSRDEHQHFPLCVVGLNISKLMLDHIRDGSFFELLNQWQQRRQNYSNLSNVNRNTFAYTQSYLFLDCIHIIYASCFYEMYIMWKNNCFSIKDFDSVLRHFEISLKRRQEVIRMIEQLENALDSLKTKGENGTEPVDFGHPNE